MSALAPMTFIVFAYNEVKRIRGVLDHATRWAAEVIVFDKGSTDGTREICQSYGDRIRLIPIPFSDRGHEDYATLFPQHATQEWIFFCTCSEIPTRKLIEVCTKLIAERGEELDLISVPRLMYFFGLHRSPSNGGVAYYPFLFHRDRAVITLEIHNNFHAKDPSRTYRILFAEDCCVHHMTHPTVRSFWLASLSYFEMEIKKDDEPETSIRDSFKNIEKLSKRMMLEGESWLPFYCALASYELGKALSVWEKAQGPGRATKRYEDLTQSLVASEWTGETASPRAKTVSVRVDSPAALKPLVLVLAKLPYLLVKTMFLFRKVKMKRD
jgi:glycosyltransferase involved in cell wall biosynthesis